MSKKLRFGVIGTGRIGKLHIDNLLNKVAGVEVACVADPMIEHSMEWIKSRGIEKAYTDYKQVIADPTVDAIMVCSSTDTHSIISLEAVNAGKHVFCEKPIDFDLDKIRAVLDAVEAKGVKFQVGFNRRFDRNFKFIKDSVAAGKIGDPHIIRVTSRDPEPPPVSYIKVSGGIFFDMMIHDFDMVRYLSGSDVVEVSATGTCLVDPAIGEAGDVDTAIVTMRFANGALGVIDNSRRAAYGYDQRIEVFGSKGQITTANETANLTSLSTAEGVTSEKPVFFFLERYSQAFVSQLDAFVDSIVNNKPTVVNANDGLQPVLIAMAATESCKKGGVPVKVGK